MESIFNTIFEMSFKASIVIIAVLIMRFLLSKAPKRYSYLLWIVVAFRLCVPYSIQSDFSLFNINTFFTKENTEIIETNSQSEANTDPNKIYFENSTEKNQNNPIIEHVDFSQAVDTDKQEKDFIIQENITQAKTDNHTDGNTVLKWSLIPIYLLGFIGMVGYGFVSFIKISKKIKNSICIDDITYISSEIDTPFTIGFIKPRIYLPLGLNEKEQQCIIAHEKFHIKRFDYIIKPFAYMLLCMHWFNPLCWIAFNRMSYDMEMSCDEKIISTYSDEEERKQYTKTLLSIATYNRFPAPNPISFNDGGNAKKRITHALYWKKPKLWVNILSFIICLAVLIACGTDYSESSEDAPIDSAITEDTSNEQEINIEQELIDAMQNKKEIISENGDSVLFNDFLYTVYTTDEILTDIEAQTFIDIDEDGINELICRLDGGSHYIILRYNENIYCYYMYTRWFQSLKCDGTYMATGGASDNYIFKMTFDENNKKVETEIARYEEDPDGTFDYKINGINVSKEEIQLFFDNWYKEKDVEFYTDIKDNGSLENETNESINNEITAFNDFLANKTIGTSKHDNIDFYFSDLTNELNQNIISKYTFADLNNDGQMEMITMGYDHDPLLTIFAYVNDKVTIIYVADDPANHTVLDNGYIFASSFLIGGGAHFDYYTFDSNYNIKPISFSEFTYPYEDYVFNNESVTKEEYQELTKDIFAIYESSKELIWYDAHPDELNIDEAKKSTTKFRLTENHPTYTAAIIYCEDGNGFKRALAIYDENDVMFQYVGFEDVESFEKVPLAMDLNFDGYTDILIPYQQSYPTGTYYQAFIWDAEYNKYSHAPSFINYPRFSLDYENKYILTCRDADMTVSRGMHKFDEEAGDFVNIGSLYFEYNRIDETFYYCEYKDNEKVNEISGIEGGYFYDFENCGIEEITEKFEEGSFWDLKSSKWRSNDYSYYINHITLDDDKTYSYWIQDLDNNGIEEIVFLNNTTFEIYTYNGKVTKIGEHDFVTGTACWYYSDNKKFPGIFYSYVEGSGEHFGYLSIDENGIVLENLWEFYYTTVSHTDPTTILSDNTELVEESIRLFHEKQEITFKSVNK